ncbi:hypothetical protein KWH83_20300, partial [Morganella morganii]|nr:hypothetical protein [Morganella morganii]
FSIMDMVPASEVVQGMQVVGGTDGDTKYNLTTDDVADLQEKLFGADGSGKMFAFTDDDGNTAFLGLDKDGKWTVSTATVTPAAADGTPASIEFEDGADVTVGPGTAAGVAAKSLETLQTMDKALADVDAMRSGLGASQNRFNSVISN